MTPLPRARWTGRGMVPSRPRVFVASSYESRRVAIAVQQNLAECATVLPWQLDALGIGRSLIDELYRNLLASDFGVFVFSPDDRVEIHGSV
jgi:predicted nucleotide-binding protein